MECDRIRQYLPILEASKGGTLKIYPEIEGLMNAFHFEGMDNTRVLIRRKINGGTYYSVPCALIEFVTPIGGTEYDAFIRTTRQMSLVQDVLT